MAQARVRSFARLPMFLGAAALIFGGAFPPARTHAAPGAEKKYSVNSPAGRYRLTTDIEKPLAQQIARHMDRIFAEYDRRLASFHTRDTRAFPLYVFAERKDYLAFMKNVGIDATNTGGMYFWNSDGEKGLAAWVEGQPRSHLFNVLQHEGLHQFVAVRVGEEIPVWLNEGLAEYFADALPLKDRFITGLVSSDRLRNVREALKTEQHVPFEGLLEMSNDAWNSRVREGDGAKLMYDEAWSVVHYLVHGGGGRYAERLEKFLQHLSHGLRAAEAFQKAFETRDYDAFEASWRKYVESLEPDPVSTAARRLEFLAAGLKELRTRKARVSTVDELRAKLVEIEFKVMVVAHGRVSTMTAADADNFAAPESGNARKPARLELTPNRDPDLPPEMRVEGLKVDVRLTWSRHEDQVVEEITFR